MHPLLTDLPPRTVSGLRLGGGLGNRGRVVYKCTESVFAQADIILHLQIHLGESVIPGEGILVHPLESVRTELLHTCRFEEQGLVWVTVDEFR